MESKKKRSTSYSEAKSAIALIIKNARLHKGIRQFQLAVTLQLHFTWVSQVENGRRMPSLFNMIRIGEYLNIPEEDYMKYYRMDFKALAESVIKRDATKGM